MENILVQCSVRYTGHVLYVIQVDYRWVRHLTTKLWRLVWYQKASIACLRIHAWSGDIFAIFKITAGQRKQSSLPLRDKNKSRLPIEEQHVCFVMDIFEITSSLGGMTIVSSAWAWSGPGGSLWILYLPLFLSGSKTNELDRWDYSLLVLVVVVSSETVPSLLFSSLPKICVSYLPEVVPGSGDSLGIPFLVPCLLTISNAEWGLLQVVLSPSLLCTSFWAVIMTVSFKRSGDESGWLICILIGSGWCCR